MVKCCGYEARPSASASAVRKPKVEGRGNVRQASNISLCLFKQVEYHSNTLSLSRFLKWREDESVPSEERTSNHAVASLHPPKHRT